MLNHISLHKNNLLDTDDGGQAMGEEMSMWSMHIGETEKINQHRMYIPPAYSTTEWAEVETV